MATRRDLREHLGTLMQTELTGVGHALAYASTGPRGQQDGVWPISLLAAEGSSIPKPSSLYVGPMRDVLMLSVLVLYAAIDDQGRLLTNDDGSYQWTETDAHDTLDAIHEELKAFFETHRTEAGYWSAVDYVDQTAIDVLDVGGTEYLRETYRLAFTS